MENKEKCVVFSLTRNIELTNEVIDKLGVERGQCEVLHFADGEIIVETLQPVRGKHVYIIQSTCNPVTESLMELLVFVDGLKRASAKEITAVIPYYGYARQDRMAKPREPITSRLVADLLQVAGVDRVVTFDLHAPQIQGFFKCPCDNMTATHIMAKQIKKDIDVSNVVVVSPDHGGVTRARNLASLLKGAPIAIFDKRRPRPNVAEIVDVIGEVSGKVAILIDDIIDTGGTIIGASEELIRRGAKEVYVCCTHPVFSKDALERLEASCIKTIYTTNTISLKRPSDKVTVISMADTISMIIECIEEGKSMSEALYR